MFVYPIDAQGTQKVSKNDQKNIFPRKKMLFNYKIPSKKALFSTDKTKGGRPLAGVPTLAVWIYDSVKSYRLV